MGKPVVSVSTPEIEKFRDVVDIATDPDEFLAHLDRVLATPASADEAREAIKLKGLEDAFVVGEVNGHIISADEVDRMRAEP